MTLNINALPDKVGIKQIGTIFKIFDSVEGGNELLSVTVELPDDVYNLKTNLTIPKNTTYFGTAERIIETVDTNNPDVPGVITTITPSTRSPITNEDGLQAGNIFEVPFPYAPILTSSINEDGSQTFHSSNVLPSELHLDEICWTVYDHKMNLLYSKITSGSDPLSIVVSNDTLGTYGGVTVTAIHMCDGVASPTGRTTFITNAQIVPISGRHSVNPHVDYYFIFDSDTADITSKIHRVELVNSATEEIIQTYFISDNKTIVIASEYLLDDMTYSLNFFVKGRLTDDAMTVEKITFNTIPDLVPNYFDPEHVYRHQFQLVGSSSIVRLKQSDLEKRADGRFLLSTDTGFGWGVMNNGVVSTALDVTASNGLILADHQFKTINLMTNLFGLIGKDSSDDTLNMWVFIDDVVGGIIIEVAKISVPDADISSFMFDPHSRRVYFANNSDLNFINISKTMSGTGVVIGTTKPDNATLYTRFAPVRNKLLVCGGTDNVYLYDVALNRYEFIAVLPAIMVNIPIRTHVLINGNIMVTAIDSSTNHKIVIFNISTLNFETYTSGEFLPNATGSILSNGVALLHNSNNAAAYLK